MDENPVIPSGAVDDGQAATAARDAQADATGTSSHASGMVHTYCNKEFVHGFLIADILSLSRIAVASTISCEKE